MESGRQEIFRFEAQSRGPPARRGFVEETEASGRDAARREPAARERGPREHADAALEQLRLLGAALIFPASERRGLEIRMP